jgi:hypothetical protein
MPTPMTTPPCRRLWAVSPTAHLPPHPSSCSSVAADTE